MARALRPVVVLMLLATILFVAAGVLDGVYPGGPAWLGGDPGIAWSSYFFALVNLGFALVIARGSERTLVGRIGLSLFFVVERTVSAFALGPKSTASVGVHLATALVELAILLGAYRVWRLGRSFGIGDLDALFAVEGVSPPPDRSGPPVADEPSTTTPPTPPSDPTGSSASTGATGSSDPTGSGGPTGSSASTGSRWSIQTGTSWRLGLVSLGLAAILVADGLHLGFVPGGPDWGLSGAASGWLVYLFAVVVLAVASRAVSGGALALRLLFATALVLFVERGFSPFALRLLDPVSLVLHALAAFVALALALDSASALRRTGRPSGHAVTSAA
jgi:hypothetical protein